MSATTLGGAAVPERLQLLISAVEQLSMARDLARVTAIVRTTARRLASADGSTFVLREGDQSFYLDEDAIEPLWSGRRFPLSACISGWSILQRQAVAIPDIYADDRVPHDAYRLTFVKSMLMVPIRTADPVGAIGIYWKERRQPTDAEIQLLQALANSAAVAMENIRVYLGLEALVHERTAQLEAANRELAAFADSVSHDLKAPLRRVLGFSSALAEDYHAQLDETGRQYLTSIEACAENMTQMVDALLQLSRWNQAELSRTETDLSALANQIIQELQREDPGRNVQVSIEPNVHAHVDRELARIVLANLLRNSWKFTQRKSHPKIVFGCHSAGRTGGSSEPPIYYVRDNGAGFRPEYAHQLFLPFRRLHSEGEFPGTGIGLATVQRVVNRHEGRVWAEAVEGEGACFFWTLSPSRRTVVS